MTTKTQSNFSVSLSPAERSALERISAKRGRAPLGAVVRQLIMEESERLDSAGFQNVKAHKQPISPIPIGMLEALEEVKHFNARCAPIPDDFGPG